ncbi:hypothetical protein [Sphingomonas alba]|uniref:Glycosyltransferase RgtA/B/C/D-like domain-containing protein n=1 Tax=Sphingomonas alba TaxID=2908208 RepID=A0ABT0RJT3_9SPHN|nr:hypothetical protein [Sphingomonas alba]MCL6682877.1 hypothetical protein [Sphingomonas alba]
MDVSIGAQAADGPDLAGPEGMTLRAQDTGRDVGRANWPVALLILALPTALALFIQFSTYPNHDVAWVLWGAREMMHGAVYGRDIIEPNPPLAWYLSMPTNVIASLLHVPLDVPFKVALMIGGIASAACLIRMRPAGMDWHRSVLLAAVGIAVLLTLEGREFGQREPLMIILVLPYLALSARLADGGAVPGASGRIAIGILAGLGFALKPYFLVLPLAIEGVLWFCGQRPRALFRWENIAAAAVILFYGLWVLLFERAYLLETIPLVREIYWSFDQPISKVAVQLKPVILGTIPFAVIAFKKRDGFGMIMAVAFAAFVFSYFIQNKGYDYHAVPARAVALLLVARFVLDQNLGLLWRIGAAALTALFLTLWQVEFIRWWPEARPGGRLHRQIERIDASIARHAAGDRFFVITVRTYPNFPAGIYAPAQYGSRTNAQWFLPAVMQLRTKGERSQSIERHARDFILYDLRKKPALVLLDTNTRGHTQGPSHFDILGFYGEDPAFRSEWVHYREIGNIGQFRQFVRIDARGGGR